MTHFEIDFSEWYINKLLKQLRKLCM